MLKNIKSLRKAFLTNFLRIHYSQFGEDVILKELLGKKKTGFYIDVGCYHPKKFSNTYFLYKRGWRGINIDMEKHKIDLFRVARRKDINILAAVSDKNEVFSIYKKRSYDLGATLVIDHSPPQIDRNRQLRVKVGEKKRRKSAAYKKYVSILRRFFPPTLTEDGSSTPGADLLPTLCQQDLGGLKIYTKTLDEIIGATQYKNRTIDLLTIDAEGHDLNVLKSLNFSIYKPNIVVVEVHATDIDTVLQSEVNAFMVSQAYRLRSWAIFSLIYVRAGLKS